MLEYYVAALIIHRFRVDKCIFLLGYGVYGGMQPSIYEVTMELIHTSSGKVVATNTTSFTCDGSKYTYRLMFKELAEVLPNTTYTASVFFKVVKLIFCSFILCAYMLYVENIFFIPGSNLALRHKRNENCNGGY